jgi:hypothetical protein
MVEARGDAMMPTRPGALLVLVLACLALVMQSRAAWAQDDVEDRIAAARRYMSVVPMAKLVNDSIIEISRRLPDGVRTAFIAQMTKVVRVDVLEQMTLHAMVKIFSLEELNALADFYGSKAGKSAMEKFGVYMAEIMPPLQRELERAMQEFQPR